MASRLTTVRPVQFTIPSLQIPFELLQNKLQQAQLGYDQFNQLSGLMPKYLEQDAGAALQYRDFVDKISNDVSQAFASGDTGKAMRMLQEGKRAITSQWQTTGLANALNSRYTEFQKNLEDLEEFHKKGISEGNTINYQLALNELKNSVKDIGYNPSKGTYNKIGKPNTPSYFDVDKEVREWIKTIDPKEYGISQVRDGYIYTTEGKKYNMREFAAQVMNDPRIQTQLALNAKYQKMNMSEDEIMDTINSLNKSQEDLRKAASDELEGIEKMLQSSDPEEVKKGQSYLSLLGLEVDGTEYGLNEIDGNAGERTKKALEQARESVQNKQLKEYSVNDIDNILYQSQLKGVEAKMLLARPDSETTKITGADWKAQERVRHTNKLKEQSAYLEEWGAMTTPTNVPVVNTAVDYSTVSKAIEATKQSFESSKRSLELIYNDPNNPQIREIFSNMEDIGKYRSSLERNRNNIEQTAIDLGVSTEQVEKAFRLFNDPLMRGLGESALNYVQSQQSLGEIEETNRKITETYINSNGVAEAEKFIKDNNLEQYGTETVKITPELLLTNPQAVIDLIPKDQPKNNKYQRRPSLTKHQEISSKIRIFSNKKEKKIQEDINSNKDKYRTALSVGTYSTDKNYSALNDTKYQLLSLPDESGNVEWRQEGGKSVKSPNLKSFDIADISPALGHPGKQTVILKGVGEDGKTYEKRSFVENEDLGNYIQNNVYQWMAEDINNNDYNSFFRNRKIARGVDYLPLNTTPKSQVGNIIQSNKSTYTNRPFSVLKEYRGTDGLQYALISMSGTSTSPTQYAHVILGEGNNAYVLKSLLNEDAPAIASSYEDIYGEWDGTKTIFHDGVIGARPQIAKPKTVQPPFQPQ